MEDEGDAGDAVAFSVDMRDFAHNHWTQRGRQSLDKSPRHCVLRVERRRSAKQVWERVLNERIVLRALNFVSSLERDRYEYRLSLRSCGDASLLALPSELRVVRINCSAVESHPHVGTFRFIHMEKLPTKAPQVSSTERGLMLWVVLVFVAFLVTVILCKRRSRPTTRRPKAAEHTATPLNASSSKPEQMNAVRQAADISRERGDSGNLVKSGSSEPRLVEVEEQIRPPVVETSARMAAFWDEDDDLNGPQAGEKGLLMTEFPEFNDELGWRDFFDSHIYQRDERRKSADEGAPRQRRTLITRATVHNEPRSVRKPNEPLPSTSSSETKRAKRSSAEELNASREFKPLAVRHAEDPSHEGLLLPNSTAAIPKQSKCPQTTKASNLDTVVDDFGEFWQM